MPKPPKKEYSKESLKCAIQEIENNVNNLSERQIAEKYGVPRTSLRFYVKNPDHKTSLGPAPILTTNEENDIEDWILVSARKGFPRNKIDILDSVQKFLKDNPRANPFADDRPGEGWWKAFLKRHPNLSIRTSEGVTKASACVSEKDIRGWFIEIQNYIAENGLSPILCQPDRIFNADETGFQLCSSSGQVIAEKGSKNVYNVEQSSSKEALTVLFTFSASGEIICPFVIYPYQRMPEKIKQSFPDGWGIGRSDNGWMTKEAFYEFIANVFHPCLVERGVEFPVILFVDGHKTHLNFHLSQLCSHLQIELIALYPNATRILQPADVAAFRPLKNGWRKFLKKWQNENPNQAVTKQNFASILKEAVEVSIRPEILVNGFRACGLYPFNPDAIDYTKCLGTKTATIKIKNDGNIPDSIVMSYDTFSNIVGNDIIDGFRRQLDQNPENLNSSQELEILFRLWQYFNKNKNQIRSVANKENKAVNTDWSMNADKNTVIPNAARISDEQQVKLSNDNNDQIEQEMMFQHSPSIIASSFKDLDNDSRSSICIPITYDTEKTNNPIKSNATMTKNLFTPKSDFDLKTQNTGSKIIGPTITDLDIPQDVLYTQCVPNTTSKIPVVSLPLTPCKVFQPEFVTPMKYKTNTSYSGATLSTKNCSLDAVYEQCLPSTTSTVTSVTSSVTPYKILNREFTSMEVKTPVSGSPKFTLVTGSPPKYALSRSDGVPPSPLALTNVGVGPSTPPIISINKKDIILPSPKILIRKSSLGEYLAYPETPVRKGKRQTERQPFAISSKMFKVAVDKKMKEKENIAKEKEHKKQLREEKKSFKIKTMTTTKKPTTKVQITKMTSNMDVGDTICQEKINEKKNERKKIPESKVIKVLKEEVVNPGKTCRVCSRAVYKSELSCSFCGNHFHISCIPRKHKDHIPTDNKDMNLFVCHLCYQINDSDSGEKYSSEDSDQDDSLTLKLYEDFNKAKKNLFL